MQHFLPVGLFAIVVSFCVVEGSSETLDVFESQGNVLELIKAQNKLLSEVLGKTERLEQQVRKHEVENRHKDALLEELAIKILLLEGKSSPDGRPSTTSKKRADDVSVGALEPVVNHLSEQMTQVSAQIHALQAKEQDLDARVGGAYTRWGHVSCPAAAELVYSGIVGGTKYSTAGGGSNYLCLHSHPVLDTHRLSNANAETSIHGGEYKICDEPECNTTPACAVCRVPRASTVMIPGTNTCSAGWTKEYSGYIMANYEAYTGNSEYICVDSAHEYIPGTQENENPNLLYYAVFQCGALPCPPYAEGKLATCVVCSK